MKRIKLYANLGQSFMEYAVLLAVVAAALFSMRVYIKRSMQGRLRGSFDEISEQYNPGTTIGISLTDLNIYSESSSKKGLSTATVMQTQDKSAKEIIRTD